MSYVSVSITPPKRPFVQKHPECAKRARSVGFVCVMKYFDIGFPLSISAERK